MARTPSQLLLLFQAVQLLELLEEVGELLIFWHAEFRVARRPVYDCSSRSAVMNASAGKRPSDNVLSGDCMRQARCELPGAGDFCADFARTLEKLCKRVFAVVLGVAPNPGLVNGWSFRQPHRI